VAKASPSQTTSSGGSRRDRLASFEAARKKEQRVRTIRLLVICAVAFMALLAYPVYLFVQDSRVRTAGLDSLGTSVDAAGCDAPVESPATGNQEHVAEGTQIEYDRFPPDSGKHYPAPAPFTKHFYAAADRPEVGTLVHNLEHGYTIAWYRSSMPADQITALQNVSKTFGDEFNLEDKFIAAPWTDDDPAGFPDGKNVVLTRWTANPDNPGDTAQQKGVRQACASVSGTAIRDFMAKYPATNTPEPNTG
jgi:hypothetical protein